MKDTATNAAIEEMGRNGRDWVRNFTWDRIAGQYEEFLLGITEKS